MEAQKITPDQAVVFSTHVSCGVFQDMATFPDEPEAEEYFKNWRDGFQREHGKLPARGVDYRIEWRPLESEQFKADFARVEHGAYNVLSDIRQVLNATDGSENPELVRRVWYLHEAMGRINAICASIADGAKLPSGRSLAVEIEGISRQALTKASVGERRSAA
ncbi:hypothetical protein K9F62_03245 [Desulfovibrio sp. JY]|nr:hypothetical protein K9F62_03245 [Desulfovibrio sp. JY]